ncbi:MAG TPA: type II toxin-antitoxin system HicB family antitoxin [Opitutaceae bacterium]
MTIRDFQVKITWDAEEKYYIAEIPDILTCSADGSTAAEAYANLEETFAVMKEAHAENGTSLPLPSGEPEVTTESLRRVADVLKISKLAIASKINPQTLAAKLQRRTALKPAESLALSRTIHGYGLRMGHVQAGSTYPGNLVEMRTVDLGTAKLARRTLPA